MSGTLTLSSLIASLDRAALSELVSSRRIAAPMSVKDPLDLAAELLKSESIAQALTRLRREALGFLLEGQAGITAQTTAGASSAQLRALGLLGADDARLAEVTDVLLALLEDRGISPASLVEETAGPGDADATEGGSADTSSWFAAALTATGQAAWVLRDLERSPAKLNRNGEVASVWLRAVEDRLSIPNPESIVELLRTAGLTRPAGSWCMSNGAAWLAAEARDRWAALATAAVRHMPSQFCAELARYGALTTGASLTPELQAFPRQYPLATETTLTAVERAAALWERLGITVAGNLSEAGVLALTGALEPEAVGGSQAGGLTLPDQAPGIYIQPDLSVIVPGPLDAANEAALAAIALPEQLGVASTLRISEATLSEAFHRGLSGDEIRELIAGLSLTEIPQPVEYLITTLSERAGSIIVSPYVSELWRTRVDCARSDLRATVLVDRRLAHLQLQELDDASAADSGLAPLVSRLRADHVLAALLDARYPARGGGGLITPSEARQAAQPPVDAAAPEADERAPSALDELIERVRAAATDSPSDISRQITLAIRDRSRIQATVEIRGESRTFTVLPVSLAAGRMRALDDAAGVERTLPLEAITEVTLVA